MREKHPQSPACTRARLGVTALLCTILVLIAMVGCQRAVMVTPTPPMPEPMPEPEAPSIDPAPSAAAVASGTYLTAVLGGHANDALTVDGAAALPDTVLTDSDVTALLAADWWKPFAELAASNPKVTALLSVLVPAYDKHIPATAFTVRIRETAMRNPQDPFIPEIAIGSFSVGAGSVAAIATQPGAERTESCYLTTTEAETLLGPGDPMLAQRVAACVSSSPGLSTMQAVEVARTCGSAGCSGAAARQTLAAVGATVLHSLVAGTAAELSNMVLAGWFTGTWVGLGWDNDDDDGIGELHEYAVMQIDSSNANYSVVTENGEESKVELGPWSHRQTRLGGEFYSGDKVLQYQYRSYPLHAIRGGAVGHYWWMARVSPEIVGTWSGMSETDTYQLTIGIDGGVMLTTSGVTMNGFVEHEQHHEGEEDKERSLIFDENGYPVLNFCGNLRMAFPDSDEVQNWRYCIDDQTLDMMYADIPPYDDDWNLNVELTR